jgi:hypothetical protein
MVLDLRLRQLRRLGRRHRPILSHANRALDPVWSFLASRKLGGLIVTEVNPNTIPAASSLAWSTVWSRRSPDSRQLGPNFERSVRRRLEHLTIRRRSEKHAGHG